MKKLILMMATLAVIASCQKDDLFDNSYPEGEMKQVVFRAGIDTSKDTKAVISNWRINWSDGDMLGGWSPQVAKTAFYKFDETTIEEGQSAEAADFVGTVDNSVDGLRLFYPYDTNDGVIVDNKYALDLTSQKVTLLDKDDLEDTAVGNLSANHIYMTSDNLEVDGSGNITNDYYTLYQVGSIVNLQLTLTGLTSSEGCYLNKVTLSNFYAKGKYDFSQERTGDADIIDKEYAPISVEIENHSFGYGTQRVNVPVYVLPTELPENYKFTITVECSGSSGKEYKGTLEHTQTIAADCKRGYYYDALRTIELKMVEKVTTASEAQEAFLSGTDNVVVTEEITENGDVEINNDNSGASKSITFDQGISSDKTVTITVKDSKTTSLDITAPAENEGNIVVDAPNTTVTINGKFVNAEVKTATDTFIVEQDSEITGTLTVTGGNVEIYGKVSNVTFGTGGESSIVKVWTVYSDGEMRNAVALGSKCSKIVLGSDIALSSEVKISSATTIDGNGNNLTFSNSGASLSCEANLKIDDITITNTGNGYAIYVPNNSEATEINISGSTLSGFAALFTKGDDATYNIVESTLNGYGVSSNNFANIYVNEEATGNTINLKGTEINTTAATDCYYYAIKVQDNTGSTTVNLTDGTSFTYDSNGNNKPDRYYFIENRVNNEYRSTFTRDNSIKYSSNLEMMSLASGLLFGNGTEETPYEIYDSYDLKALPYYTSEDNFAYFKQMADIEYKRIDALYAKLTPSPMTTVTPTESSTTVTTSNMISENLYGVYDGNGHSINNWGYNEDVTGDSWGENGVIGLFAKVYYGSTIKNLTLTCDAGSEGILTTENCQIKNIEAVGAFAGYSAGVIENCVNNLPITVYSADSYCRVGGIYGKPYYSTTGDNIDCSQAIRCINNGNILLTNLGSAGGILGGGTSILYKAVAAIENCTVNGNVTAPYAYEFNVDPAGDWGDTYHFFDDGGNVCNGTITSTEE